METNCSVYKKFKSDSGLNRLVSKEKVEDRNGHTRPPSMLACSGQLWPGRQAVALTWQRAKLIRGETTKYSDENSEQG